MQVHLEPLLSSLGATWGWWWPLSLFWWLGGAVVVIVHLQGLPLWLLVVIMRSLTHGSNVTS